jgi:adenosylhomocysteine nucleosidase
MNHRIVSRSARRLACLVAILALSWGLPTMPAAQEPRVTVQPAGQAGLQADLVIQGAVDTELQPLLSALEEKETIQIASWTFWRGRIGGRRVVVSRTEVGPMNASVATALAVAHFHPSLIINQGTAGALDPELRVFDVVVGQSAVDYGAFRSSHADAGAGVDLARWSPMSTWLRPDGKDRVEFRQFPGDREAAAVALATPNPRGRVVTGVIGSAFEFNREVDRLAWIRKTYGASSEDMESAFAAGAAAGFGTRFLAIRIISDSEYHAPEFQRVAGEYCAAFVLDVVRLMTVRPPAAAEPKSGRRH